MENFSAIILITFMLLCSHENHAQSSQPKLNQVELMKQMVGSWKCNIAKDTTVFWNAKSYGTGLECDYKSMTKMGIITEKKELYGYDLKIDKYINAGLIKGKDISIYVFWFTSNNKYIMIPYSDISNSEKATFRVEGVFKSPDMIVENITLNNRTIRIDTWTRIIE